MYKLIVKSSKSIIIDKTLSKDECESVKTVDVQWVCDVFKKYIGLDISDYTIREYQNSANSFTINIREEDLVKLREDKLSNLLN